MTDVTMALCDAGARNISCHSNRLEKLDESYDALTFVRDDVGIGININLNEVQTVLDKGADYDEVVSKTVDHILDNLMDEKIGAFRVLTGNNLSYDDYKKNLTIDVVSVEGHEEMLKNLPHKVIEDLAAVYRFVVDSDENGRSTLLINNDMLNIMGVSEEQLKADADLIAPITRPVIIRNMNDMMLDLLRSQDAPEEIIEMMCPTEVPQLFVATVEDGIHGAGILAYPDFFKEAAEYLGGSYYILPSSVHEVLLYPDSDDACESAAMLKDMVTSVNADVLDPKDKLTDNVYHYDAEAKIFETGEKYVNRISSQQAIG